ncbi:MAG: pyridoxal-phosphate dependent enzyme, partial [Anaerolineales bacterium]
MSKPNFIGYRCSLCDSTYGPDEVIYTCPKDSGNLDVIQDIKAIKNIPFKNLIYEQEFSLWRYLKLLPLIPPGGEGTPLRAAGWTPFYSPPKLKKKLGLQYLWVKDESSNPTASFKDRASAVVVARAQEIDAETVVTASTGNAGAALAGMSAAVDQNAVIIAPKNAPPAKVAQLLIYGAQVFLVDGNYDSAFDLSIQAAQEFDWYCRNTGYNPFTLEGKKTAAYEIWEYLLKPPLMRKHQGDQIFTQEPLSIFVSVGDGNIISGLHKGFKDLAALGLLERMPKIYGVQSQGSAAIANAFFKKTEQIIPITSDTLADSISVDMPRDGVRALRAATQTGGAYITVSDAEILDAISILGEV